MAYVTADQCDERRANCPGTRVIPVKSLVTILLAMLTALIISHLMLSTGIAANSRTAAATNTEVQIRADQQKVMGENIDEILKTVHEIKGHTSGKD